MKMKNTPPRHPDTISSKINGYEECLRYLYTVLIAVSHIWYLFFDKTFFLEGAYLGVDFFFILSGYHLINTYKKKQTDAFSLVVNRYKGMLLIYVGSLLCFLLSGDINQIIKRFYTMIPDILCVQSSGFFYPSVNVILWYVSAMQIATLFIISMIRYNENMFFKVIAPLLILFGYSTLFLYLNNLDGTSNIKGYIIPLGLVRAFAGISLGILVNSFTNKLISQLKDNQSLKKIALYYTVFIISLAISIICIIITPHSTSDFMCLLAFPAMIISIQVLGIIYRKSAVNRFGRLLCAVFGKQMTLSMYCFSIVIWGIIGKIIPMAHYSLFVSTLLYLLFLFLISGAISRFSDFVKYKTNVNQ